MIEFGLFPGVSYGYGTKGTQKTSDRICCFGVGPLFDTRRLSALGCEFAM